MAVPVCTLASGWYRSFYKTEKSITGRRAHNPIHPGGCHRRCSSLFCGETNTATLKLKKTAPFSALLSVTGCLWNALTSYRSYANAHECFRNGRVSSWEMCTARSESK
ncbi:hypothetical protein FG871_12470 [Escherichia coli]|nr:hypothetical protein FG871_12470 [Escherichia coli]